MLKHRVHAIVGWVLVAALTAASVDAGIVHVKVFTDSEAKGYEAYRALDGKTNTFWHTEYSGNAPNPPHNLTVDLGKPYEIKGFIYLPRPGGGNGTIGDYEFYAGNDLKKLGEPIVRGKFEERVKESKVEVCLPAKVRYVRLRATSEANGRPWASAAGFTLLSPGNEFRAKPQSNVTGSPAVVVANPHVAALPSAEAVCFDALTLDLKERKKIASHAAETFNKSALIFDSDRDPVDIISRRTGVLLADIRKMKGAPDLSGQVRKLAALQQAAKDVAVSDTKKRIALFSSFYKLRRTIAFANPLLNFDKLLFIKRPRSKFNHMCDQYYGAYAVSGGGLFVLSNPFSDKPTEKNVLENSIVERGRLKGTKLNTGGFLSPELSYDGKTIYFAYVEGTGSTGHIRHLDHANRGHWDRGRCYHLFSVKSDGTQLQQLTDGTWNEFDPCPLPNGRVAFISERRGGYLRCGRACPSYTVFDMMPDGSDIRMLSPHENNEWQPSVTHDGMIIYTRWDYVDRHGCTAHHPWIMSPDGRDSRAMHGNFSIKRKRADMEMDLRAIPGSHKIIGTAAPHHGQAYGSIIIYDPRIPDDDAMAPVKRVTPDVGFPESQGGKQVYGTPWPLSEDYFLCVYDFGMRGRSGRQGRRYYGGNYGIYLVDAFGNKILIHRDPTIASLSPMPLRATQRPPVVLERCERLSGNPSKKGTMAVMNVYDSLKPWPKGTKIAALRIYQTYPMSVPSGYPPHETGKRIAEARDSVNLARRIVGTVPVESDGSAYFKVPALREFYFQALDKDGLAVQSMRSATWVQPGEQLICQGCHEPKNQAPLQPTRTALALQRPPSIPKPDVDGTSPFSYPRLVQPVLDKKCIGCHTKHNAKLAAGGTGKKAPLLDRKIVKSKLGKMTSVYRSYDSLIFNYAFWKYGDQYRTIPGKFGARASKLYQMLKKGHHDLELTKEEMHRITVWLDSLSNFYGVYEKEGGIIQLKGGIAHPTLE